MRKDIPSFKITLFSLLFLTLFITKAKAAIGDQDSSGVKFRSITLEQALVAAKAENKPVFVHCFADWCGYCKYMVDSVYPNKEVSAFYNSHFICLKMDMEKEGDELNRTIKAHSFPVFLFYDTTGELMHRAAGRRYKYPFLELANAALDPNRQMRTYKKRYEDGTALPFQVEQYFRMQEVAGMDAQLQINEYMMKQPDSEFTNSNNWRIMYDILKDPTMPIMKRFISNKKELAKIHTADSVNNKLIQIFNTYLMQYVQQLDTVGYEKARQKIVKMDGLDLAEKICALAELNKFKMKSEWDKYKAEGRKFIPKYASDDFRRINDVVGIFYDHFSGDKELMAFAEKWILHSISIADQYKGNHLLASVSVSLGKKEQALNAANHAIELAKIEGKDYSTTTQLLNYIQRLP